jgi:hypothetical protein
VLVPDARADPGGAGPAPTGADTAGPPTPRLSPFQVLASAAAAVCASFFASYAGVTGTLIGAGVTSVVATVAGTVYNRWLVRGHLALRRGTAALSSSRPLPEIRLPEPLARHRRAAVLGVSVVGIFLLAIGVVTGVEAATGRPLSKVVSGGGGGGTSVGRLFGESGSGGPGPAPSGGTSTRTSTPPTSGRATSTPTHQAATPAATAPAGGAPTSSATAAPGTPPPSTAGTAGTAGTTTAGTATAGTTPTAQPSATPTPPAAGAPPAAPSPAG